jgi:hypothetical protein
MADDIVTGELRAKTERRFRDASDPARGKSREDLSNPRPWFAFYAEVERSWRVHDAKGDLVTSHLSQRDAEDIARAGSI